MQANTQEYSLPKPGLYRHFRNRQLYQVLSTARHSETLESLIVYQALYGTYGTWVRPAKMFLEEVTGPDGVKTPRFIFVGPGAAELPALH